MVMVLGWRVAVADGLEGREELHPWQDLLTQHQRRGDEHLRPRDE
jgi:hypothetical protein